MKNLSKIVTVIVLMFACTEETIRFNDLVSITKNKEALVADGSDTAELILKFNDDANIDLIDASAEIFNGRFIDSENSTLAIEPTKNPDGVITAKVIVASTTIADSLKIIFSVNEFNTPIALGSILSVPDTINLQASAFSVSNSFDSEIQIVGNVLNNLGKKASNGYQIIVNDTFQNGTPVNGLYRETSLITNNGQISFIYSPGAVSPNQFINLEAIVLDQGGAPIGVANQIQIYITNND